jgi:dTDP-4-amino-4,6-dideoxygalactose transaminase
MIRKIPIIAASYCASDVVAALGLMGEDSGRSDFARALTGIIPAKDIFLTNSGVSAFHIILKALSARSSKKQVILPAYTAGCLVHVTKQLSLQPVLCDITL